MKTVTPPPTAEKTDIDTTKQTLKDNFALLGDWQNRYAYLIDLGKQLNERNKHLQLDKNRFYGCQASVWFEATIQGSQIHFEGCSDSVIVAGLMAIVFKVYSGRDAETIINTSTDFLHELDLLNNLSSHRSTGLIRMIEEVKHVAHNSILIIGKN